MFNLLQKKQDKLSQITLKLTGLHCNSCAMSIDNDLEEIADVHEASTNFAKNTTKICFDAKQVDVARLKKSIQDSGYQVID